MNESVHVLLQKLLERQPSLRGVVVSDKDGVTLAQAFTEQYKDVKVEQSIAATFFLNTEQVSKAEMGAILTNTALYENLTLMHIVDGGMVVTLAADPDISVGALHALAPELKERLAPLKNLISRE